MPLEEKKANGMLDTWTVQKAGTLDERTQLARQQLEQAKAQGDEAGAAAWQQELRQLERSRLGNAMDAKAATQQDMFGVGQYDTSTPLLSQQPAQPQVEIPADAANPITAKTSPGRIESAAESLMGWANSGIPGEAPLVRSMEQAMAIIKAKGAILNTDKVPGLEIDLAWDHRAMGKSTPETQAMAAAYKQFYGLDDSVKSEKKPIRLSLADGTVLSHGTSMASAKKIMAGGFRPSSADAGGAILGDGVYMTDVPTYAGAYGNTALSGPLPSGVKILDLAAGNRTAADFAEEIGVGKPAEVFDGEDYFSTEQQAKIRQWALDNGYDGIRFYPVFSEAGGSAPEVVIYKPAVADAIVGANLIGDLGRAMGNLDPKTGMPKGLSKKALKQLQAGDSALAIQEVSAMSEVRIQALQGEIESIKQRAIEEGC
jgi:hypothetical protein